MRERVARGEEIEGLWRDEDDEIYVWIRVRGRMVWARYREGPEWDELCRKYVEMRKKEEKPAGFVRVAWGSVVGERGAGRGLAAHYPRVGVVPEVVPGPRLLEVREEMEERRNRQQEEEVVEAKIRYLEDQERQREEERTNVRMSEGENKEDLENGEWIQGADGIMRKFSRRELERQKEEAELLSKIIKRRRLLKELRRIRRWGGDQEALSRLRTEVGDDNLEWLAVQERRMDAGELSEGSLTPVEEETEESESEQSGRESEELEGAVGGVLEPWEVEERRVRERQRETSKPVGVVKPK